MKQIRFTPEAFLHSEIQSPAVRYAAEEYIFSGVYFLFDGDEIVYIGQSVSVLSRISSHKADGKAFTSFGVLRCGAEWLIALEAACILKFKPKLNRRGNKYDYTLANNHLLCSTNVTLEGPSLVRQELQTTNRLGLLKPYELSMEINVPTRTLTKWRRTGEGPPFLKTGKTDATIAYKVSDVNDWLQQKNAVPLSPAHVLSGNG